MEYEESIEGAESTCVTFVPGLNPLCCGFCCQGLPTFNFLGVVLVLLGVVADAITCNYEETKFFHGHKCSQAEVVYYSSLLGLGFSVLTLWGT